MDKQIYEELLKRTADVDQAILNTAENKCNKDTNSICAYLKENEVYFPDNIVSLGKGNINITLHNPMFNNIPHYHNFFEIIYVYEGQLINNINNETITLDKNECLIQYPGVKHSILKTSEDAIVLNIIIDQQFFKSSYYKLIFDSKGFYVFDKRDNNKYLLCQNLNKIFKKLVDVLVEMFLSEEEYSQILLDNLLMVLLMEMLKSNNTNAEDEFTKKLYSYISQNISTISLKETSSYFGYHPKYFSALVKNKIGKSFKDIIMEKKMEKATYYLVYTDYSNSMITTLIGYENNLSFYNNFKKIYNCSPNDYRKKAKSL